MPTLSVWLRLDVRGRAKGNPSYLVGLAASLGLGTLTLAFGVDLTSEGAVDEKVLVKSILGLGNFWA